MDLREFYESLDHQAIVEFVQERRQEDLHLDFKCVGSNSLSSDDRKHLAIALSGFANSAGGIVVWGVDARKDPDDVDAACELFPILGLKKFITHLNSYTGQCVVPSVENVEHKAIPLPDKDDSGFAATIIPESMGTPHMARAREHRYYKRSGSSSLKMEHFEVEDMFGRRPKPRLELMTQIVERGARPEIIIGLRNTGRGIATFPYLYIRVEEPYVISAYGIDGNRHVGLPVLPMHRRTGREESFGGTSAHAVYPDSELPITKIVTPVKRRFTPPNIRDMAIHYAICCEGMPKKEGTTHIPGKMFIAE